MPTGILTFRRLDCTFGELERGSSIAWRRAGHRILTAAAAIVLVSLTWIARAQVRYWHDSETLWEHSLAVTKDNDVPDYGLGECTLRGGN